LFVVKDDELLEIEDNPMLLINRIRTDRDPVLAAAAAHIPDLKDLRTAIDAFYS